ncbi:MAG: glycosyltransferase family 39 protein [Vicinamibacterales bacterium]|nr:glycosyltransferase family 39 protein [Vicinamibacterales bacterium]
MRSFSPSSSSRILVAAGTGALLVLIVILITGGFVIDAGPLHLSARRIAGPLVIAVAAWAAAAFQGRAILAASAASISDFLDTHAVALALVIAAAAAGVGVAYGTYAASGSDASGYVSQSELLASARIIQDEPLARQGAWREGTATFAPLGYRPGQREGELVPTYPPGLPLTMAAARLIGGELGAYLVSPLLGALAMLCTYLLGARLHSRRAGAIAAALLATSPIFLLHIVQPMSDVAVTAWWTLAILLALSPAPASVIAAGIATGIALITRPNLLPLIVAPALAAAGLFRGTDPKRSPDIRHLALFLAGTVPAVATQLLLQWHLYGNPLTSGYGRVSDFFAVAGIWPNLRGYAWRLLVGEAPALSLAAISLLALAATRRRATASSVSTILWIWLVVTVALLICYLPYVVYTGWAYLRFFLPALPLTFVLVAALLTAAMTLLPAPTRGVALLALLVTACSLNVAHASREQAFNLRRYDARYRSAGRYLDAVLPANAVVLAVQESGSARYYAHVPIVRWDLLGADLDGTVAALRALGRHPVFLVEDWEMPDFASRFKASPMATLDWAPRADIGDETRALLFDPADRGSSSDRSTDRVH